MPLDTFELISAALREGPIAAQVQAAVSAMPPVTDDRPRKALDFAPVVGVKAGVVYEAMAAVDGPFVLADLITILDLDPAGALAAQIKALELLLEDIKD
jgi:hypothetical protein